MTYENRFDDRESRSVVKKFLMGKGMKVHDNPDQYGIDLIGIGTGGVYGFELEHRQYWDRDDFPFDTIHVPIRKAKFKGGNVLYVVLNKKLTKAIIFPTYLMKRIVKVDTPREHQEEFYDVDREHCNIYDLEDV